MNDNEIPEEVFVYEGEIHARYSDRWVLLIKGLPPHVEAIA